MNWLHKSGFISFIIIQTNEYMLRHVEYTIGTYAFSKCSPYASDQSEKDFTFRSQKYEVPENISKFSKIPYQTVLLRLLIWIFTVRL